MDKGELFAALDTLAGRLARVIERERLETEDKNAVNDVRIELWKLRDRFQ